MQRSKRATENSSSPGTGAYRLGKAALVGYGVCVLLALLLVPLRFLPAEDAVILWAYSKNLALHGSISYFAGGPPVEGATDFGWMLFLAAVIRCGGSPFVATAIVNVLCLLGTAVCLVRLAGRRVTAARVLVIAGAAGCTPQVFAAASGFATLLDALLLTAAVVYTVQRDALKAALASLLLCLFRPDGVVFAVPLLIGLLYRSPHRSRDAGRLAAGFVVPGSLYFLWRLRYFHELLPLPFLVKANAHRVLHTVVASSVRASWVFVAFTALVVVALWRSVPGRLAQRWLVVPLVLLPTLFYWCMRLDQNVAFRFYSYLPLAAAILLACHWQQLGHRPASVVGLLVFGWLALLAMPLKRELRTFLDLQSPQLQDIALQLAAVPRHGAMLSSEAGILPYYSGWHSTDPWGLNTPLFAHHFVQPSDVARMAPSLIHLHPDAGEGCEVQASWKTPYRERSWQALTRNMIAGAAQGGYELWQTSYGAEHYRLRKHWAYGEGDVACWFVRRGTAEQPAIEAILARHHGVAKGVVAPGGP